MKSMVCRIILDRYRPTECEWGFSGASAKPRQVQPWQFPPATAETVTAARAAVTAAEQARVAECEKRGPRCREREKEEEGKRDSLAAVLTNKVLTVRAAELDADAKAIRARIAKAPRCSMPTRLELRWKC